MWHGTRRQLLQTTAAMAAVSSGLTVGGSAFGASDEAPAPDGIELMHPRGRVPLSFFIDDSTCLVNMGHFCMPQFAEAWPDRDEYKKPWKSWPREIPDSFVREFALWCSEHGVKGKYSIVPYPALVGCLDRELPGWSRRELRESLKLVRQMMLPSWDIHPEMITHTRVLDLRTGRPLPEVNAATMENWYPQGDVSVDELAAYMAYALRILKNCDLPCEGITTPGGFGNGVEAKLPLAVGQAVRDVFAAELPHYFKYVREPGEDPVPTLEGQPHDPAAVVVNVPAHTGDWFGNWDGDSEPQPDRYADKEAQRGRLVQLIEQGQPAVMLCHWPGLYSHGTKKGFAAFKQVILALEARFAGQTTWMKISELARYWAARKMTRIERSADRLTLTAPFACPSFTFGLPASPAAVPTLREDSGPKPLKAVANLRDLDTGTFLRQDGRAVVCLDLPRGQTTLTL